MKEELLTIRTRAEEKLLKARTIKEVDDIRVAYLGKKGQLTAILKQMGTLSSEERPLMGQLANEVRETLEKKIEEGKKQIRERELLEQLEQESIDVTIPGHPRHHLGKKHPISAVLEEIENIFIGMGFRIAEGPEIESDYYNFEALNIPKDHPARDTQDTFYINDQFLLRTQTSPVQIRVMENEKPPIRVISPGRVYRSDAVDATHSPIFHQVEGLVVDRGITFSDLKGTLETFVRNLYGFDSVIRFRPHHFPFTEPSAEVDIQCFHCTGKGCSLCKQEGYIEILGCGMVHPKVLANCGIDHNEYSGFAFGMGLERIVMRRYHIQDLRLFFENDQRFLEQF